MLTTLTERQRRFVAAYVGPGSAMGCNAGEAARIAGYAWPEKQGPRLLRFPAVRAEIDRRLDAFIAAHQAARKTDILASWAAFRRGHALSRRLGQRSFFAALEKGQEIDRR